MAEKDILINEENLIELEKKTKDSFTKKLIEDLKKQIKSESQNEMHLRLSFERIHNLIEHENKKEKLEEFKKNKYNSLAYELNVTLKGKQRKLLLNGEFMLNEISEMIQQEFDLEPMHLYEFEIGNYKFGPECDEWQEIFDSLDDYKLGSAISIAGLKKGDRFRFLYDFGDKILFKVEILDIKKLDTEIEMKDNDEIIEYARITMKEHESAWQEFFKDKPEPKNDEEERKEQEEYAHWYNFERKQSDTGKTPAEMYRETYGKEPSDKSTEPSRMINYQWDDYDEDQEEERDPYARYCPECDDWGLEITEDPNTYECNICGSIWRRLKPLNDGMGNMIDMPEKLKKLIKDGKIR